MGTKRKTKKAPLAKQKKPTIAKKKAAPAKKKPTIAKKKTAPAKRKSALLRGLDAIDWASLTHAHGAAQDLPAILRGLATGSTVERSDALQRMASALVHQGSSYSATVAALPFLIEIVRDVSIPEKVRANIVHNLARCAGSDERSHISALEKAVTNDEHIYLAARLVRALLRGEENDKKLLAMVDELTDVNPDAEGFRESVEEDDDQFVSSSALSVLEAVSQTSIMEAR